ncbi:MAG: hypothetical protein AB7P21_17360 [Lautropia sp.]
MSLPQALEPMGFFPGRLKISRQARQRLQMTRSELTYTRDAAEHTVEFLHFEVPADVKSGVRGFAGWTSSSTISGPESVTDLPQGSAEEFDRSAFTFPFFELPTAAGRSLAVISHTASWLLVPPKGDVPMGGDDEALAARIAVLTQAYVESEQAAGSPDLQSFVQDLASRIANDVATYLLPYLAARSRGARRVRSSGALENEG